MSAKRIKFETPEAFKAKVVEEFLPTLQHSTPCQVVSQQFPHVDVCQLQVMTNQGMKVYSIYRDSVTKYAEYFEGSMGKYPDKNIN